MNRTMHQAFQSVRDPISPRFAVIEPTLAARFDHHALSWHDDKPEVNP